MNYRIFASAIVAAGFALSSQAAKAEPKIVSGPAEDAQCYVPWSQDTKFFQYPAKQGP